MSSKKGGQERPPLPSMLMEPLERNESANGEHAYANKSD